MTRVMIVDDEMEMSRLLKMLLELEGFTVETEPTGEGALVKAAANVPDVFMVDYHLHDMSGEDLIRRIRAVEVLAKTPIVVASGRDVEIEVKRAGATDFMLKPFEPDELIEVLRRVAARAVQEAAAPAQPSAAPVTMPAGDPARPASQPAAPPQEPPATPASADGVKPRPAPEADAGPEPDRAG